MDADSPDDHDRGIGNDLHQEDHVSVEEISASDEADSYEGGDLDAIDDMEEFLILDDASDIGDNASDWTEAISLDELQTQDAFASDSSWVESIEDDASLENDISSPDNMEEEDFSNSNGLGIDEALDVDDENGEGFMI